MQPLAYLEKFNLERHPFPVAPDDMNFFISSHIEQVMTELVHGIKARKGFMVLAGDVGLGKTTLARRMLTILAREEVCTSFVFHTSLKHVDLLREINRDFGMRDKKQYPEPRNVADQLRRLNDFLLARFHKGRNCVIIIDDAQNLDRESLELVRMISNLEAGWQKLVQILLVGQTELLANLRSDDLRQLKSRMIITKIVRPLCADEIRNYIMFKLNLAGNAGRISITRHAYHLLFKATKGNFRQINIIMDRCLYVMCHGGSRCIDTHTVRLAKADLHSRQPRKLRLRPALAAWMALPCLLLAGAWALHISTGSTVSAAVREDVQYDNVSPSPVPEAQPNGAGIGGKPADRGDEDVAVFLKAQHLSVYTAQFNQAMSQGGLDVLADKIYRERGLQLVRLNTLPVPVRRQYGALAVPGDDETSTQWMLFWKPVLTLNRFYFRYKGDEIQHLQELLAAAQFYKGKLDRIVGTRLMNAVIAFQKRKGLPVNGFPDPATVFLLCHQQEG